ncbi:MAG: DNA polymerase IV [Opitutaceae bacterium]|nr:DNA polymerase IV [Opitutaceae bacterium]
MTKQLRVMASERIRKIIHLDMDCFFAAIEIRNNPSFRGQPVAVGGTDHRRGVLTTCNYEAGEFGIHSAMPIFMALEKCPHLIITPIHFDDYRQESMRIRELMTSYSDILVPLSLDEAYIDVSHIPENPSKIASQLRKKIYQTTGLHASAGIAPNKLLAKIASDWNKPNGQFEVKVDQIAAFMENLSVKKIWGIGKVASERLEKVKVTTCGQMQQLSPNRLQSLFGKFGKELYHLCRGIDERSVKKNQIRKSISTEHTFSQNLKTLEDCSNKLLFLLDDLEENLGKHAESRRITKVFIKIKFSDFSRTTVERTGLNPSLKTYRELLQEGFGRKGQPVRLLGIGVRFAEESADRNQQLEFDLHLH